MLSLLFLSVLLSGALPSFAKSVTLTDFTAKLRDLRETVPVFIIHSEPSHESVMDVRSTLTELENHLSRKVYLHEIFGNSDALFKNSTCTNRKLTGSSAVNNLVSRLNKINARSLSEMKYIMTNIRNKTEPIFVISIYSEYNANHIRNIQCWIRDKKQNQLFVVTIVHDLVEERHISSVDSFVTEITEPIENSSNSKEYDDHNETYTGDSKVQGSSAENRSEADSGESDFTESGTEVWVSSSVATKSISEAVIRRPKPHVYGNNEDTLKSYPKTFPFDYWLYYNRQNVGDDSPGPSNVEETLKSYPKTFPFGYGQYYNQEKVGDDSPGPSYEWDSPSTKKSTIRPSILKPTTNESLENFFQKNNDDNVEEINYDEDKGSSVMDSIYNGVDKVNSRMKTIGEKVMAAGRASVQAVKSGYNKMKQYGLDAINKVTSFF